MKKTILPLLATLLILPACSSVSKKAEPLSERQPASFCQLDAVDPELSQKIIEQPAQFDRKIRSYLRSLIQAYFYGEEPRQQFDRMLDEETPPEKLFSSLTYKKLLVLKHLTKDLQRKLEDITFVRTNYRLTEAGPTPRERIVNETMGTLKAQVEELLKGSQGANDSQIARLATFDLLADFEIYRNYYLTCNADVLDTEQAKTLKVRQSLVEEVSKLPLRKNAHRAWAPEESTFGLDIGHEVSNILLKMRVALSTLGEALVGTKGHSPQSLDPIRPDTGGAGNITGNTFPAGVWALTYDDGPSSVYTPRVLDNLATHRIPATFFVLGSNLKDARLADLALRTKEAGHNLAPHSMTHPEIPKLSQPGKEREIIGSYEAVQKLARENPTVFRLPYGAGVSNTAVRQMIKDLGMVHVFWNVDTLDWQDKNPESVYQRALRQMTKLGRGVILFHDVHPQSVIASEKVMRYLADPVNRLEALTVPDAIDRVNKP